MKYRQIHSPNVRTLIASGEIHTHTHALLNASIVYIQLNAASMNQWKKMNQRFAMKRHRYFLPRFCWVIITVSAAMAVSLLLLLTIIRMFLFNLYRLHISCVYKLVEKIVYFLVLLCTTAQLFTVCFVLFGFIFFESFAIAILLSLHFNSYLYWHINNHKVVNWSFVGIFLFSLRLDCFFCFVDVCDKTPAAFLIEL